MKEDPLIEPGRTIATTRELADHPTKKFRLNRDGGIVEGFVVRLRDQYFAYVNQCRHAGTPLDWTPNEFFDETGDRLLCRTHGALYDPATGHCLGGPCTGQFLFAIEIVLTPGGEIQLTEDVG